MAHKLTERERSNMWDAFSNWDTNCEGTISERDLCKVVELLGKTPSADLRMISDHRDADSYRVDFEEFVIMIAGPPWEPVYRDYKTELGEAFAAIDDEKGYVPLRDLMRVLHEHMADSGYYYTDDEMLELYRHALDVSFFETNGKRLAPETMWKVFEEEFADVRKGHPTESADSVDDYLRFRAGDDGEAKTGTANLVSFTVVDLGGKQLMLDTVASTWSMQALQEYIEAVLGLPVHRQVLYLAQDDGFQHELSPQHASLSKAGLSDGSMVVLVMKNELKLDYKQFIARLFDGKMASGDV